MAYNFKKSVKKTYRKVYGHKSPFRRVYGSRNPGQAIGATYKTARGVAMDVAKLAAVVANIKSKQNNEKNYVDTDVLTGAFGQVSANADMAFGISLIPSISQGDGQGNRHGNSLKLTGMSIPLQFSGMSACEGPRKIRVSLLKVMSADNGVTSSEAISHYWDVNPLTGLRDYNCPRNYRNGGHDGITCVRSQTYYLKPPSSITGTVDKEKSIITAKFNVKLDQVLRYHTNADTAPLGIAYFLCFQADSGNANTGTASTLDVPVKEINTGIEVRIANRFWYVDN